jgi:hypothetical protein
MSLETQTLETQNNGFDLSLLAQFAVKSKAVKNMSVSEARHEVQVTLTDKSDSVKTVTLRLARVIVDLGELVPNCDRLDVPNEMVDNVSQMLTKAIKDGLLDKAISNVLERLNKTSTNEKPSTQEGVVTTAPRIIETIEDTKKEVTSFLDNGLDPEILRLAAEDEAREARSQNKYGTVAVPVRNFF